MNSPETMTITIELFAGAREAAGTDRIEIELASSSTYADLATAIAEQCKALAPIVQRSAFASNAGYVTSEQTVDPTHEIALIPPVSGG